MNVVAVIPARLASSRLPRKVLADLHGQPMLWHVWKRVKAAERVDAVFIATDSVEVMAKAFEWGATAFMTPVDCVSGSDRVAAVLERHTGEFILNVQADEPLLAPDILDQMVDAWVRTSAAVVTPIYPLKSLDDVRNASIVKVVRAADSAALYFSRNPIPHVRDAQPEVWLARARYWGHLGIYGYQRSTLAAFPNLPSGPLERAEKLEQLRFLENGISVMTVEVDTVPSAVDTPEDLERVRGMMASARFQAARRAEGHT